MMLDLDPGSRCRRNDDRRQPCPSCGFFRREVPSWVRVGAVFALRGDVFRVAGIASTNRGTFGGYHFYDLVSAERVGDSKSWRAASEPRRKLRAQEIIELPRFRVEDLSRALYLVDAR